jgi:hypothetical protein
VEKIIFGKFLLSCRPDNKHDHPVASHGLIVELINEACVYLPGKRRQATCPGPAAGPLWDEE